MFVIDEVYIHLLFWERTFLHAFFQDHPIFEYSHKIMPSLDKGAGIEPAARLPLSIHVMLKHVMERSDDKVATRQKRCWVLEAKCQFEVVEERSEDGATSIGAWSGGGAALALQKAAETLKRRRP